MFKFFTKLQIYPYWNVNPESEEKREKDGSLQIYPYWNVNEFALSHTTSKIKTSNLSILECKSNLYDKAVYYDEVFKSIHTGM